jgi:hypothetical protein
MSASIRVKASRARVIRANPSTYNILTLNQWVNAILLAQLNAGCIFSRLAAGTIRPYKDAIDKQIQNIYGSGNQISQRRSVYISPDLIEIVWDLHILFLISAIEWVHIE